MCGINGIINLKQATTISRQVQEMNSTIIHRGPDDNGVYVFEDKVAMGMQRLSIIDLSTGHQPLYNDAKNIVIVFNGEIYNYKDLKYNLEQKGIAFKTTSDTEVLLKLYEIYGVDCLQMLNGMFAFAIHDVEKNKVFIARDRFGEKPLYYYHSDENFIWASELKSIIKIFPHVKKINKKALNLFFSLTYIPAPHTIYDNVFKLKPGHYLEINSETLEKKITQYWDIDLSQKIDTAISYSSAKKKVKELLFESVEKRMIADVPLGVFLSGGVDSTIIAAIMAKLSNQKIKTFSVGYQNKRYDESARAKLVTNHVQSEHYSFILNYDELFNKIEDIILNYDEPYADSSCLPTYFISDKTVQHVKVALTGDGGDEVFGGYNKYLAIHYNKMYQAYVPAFIQKKLRNNSLLNANDSKSVFTKIKKIINSFEGDVVTNHLNMMALGFQQNELKQLLKNDNLLDFKKILLAEHDYHKYIGTDDLKLLRYIDKEISLEGDMLVKIDRASMLCSLECRSPFLDHRLMELTYQLPDNYLLKGRNKKRILKDSFEDMLPKGFFNAPKSGFEIPVGQWFREHLKEDLNNTLSFENLNVHNFFNVNYVRELVTAHINATADYSWKLWSLYCFQKWYMKNFN